MKDAFYSIGILLTFIIAVWNIVNNYRISRRTAFINTVTSERIKWIEKLRDNISLFCGLTYTWVASEIEGKPEELEYIKQIDKLRHLIRLQLNPAGEYDKEIERLIAKIPDLTHVSQKEELRASLDQLIKVTQKLLKNEWDKAKEESKRGDLKDEPHCLDSVAHVFDLWCKKLVGRVLKLKTSDSKNSV